MKISALKTLEKPTKIDEHMKEPGRQGRNYAKLDGNTILIVVYSDYFFANNENSSSQLCYLVLLNENLDNCITTHYPSHEVCKAAGPIFGQGFYAFADVFDYAHIVWPDLEPVIGRHIQLETSTISYRLSEIIFKRSVHSEIWPTIDADDISHAYGIRDTSTIRSARIENNLADAFESNQTLCSFHDTNAKKQMYIFTTEK